MASERERIFPQTPESWQFGNCGPLVECHVLHVGNSTIVMAAHARSWGAIDPALRPPPSSVPQRTMAGAFYPQFFPQTTTTTQYPVDHLCWPKCATLHPRLGNQEDQKDFQVWSDRFPLLPVMHWSVHQRISPTAAVLTPILQPHFGHLSNRSHETDFVVVGRTGWASAMTEILGLSVIDLPTVAVPRARDGGKRRGAAFS